MEFEEAYLFPFECMELLPERVLVIAPHPDDETYGCGGTICRFREQGSEVHVVVLTDGAAGDWRKRYDPEQYVQLRENEFQQAIRHLGVQSSEFWRYPDRELHRYPELGERIKSLIQDYRPTLVFCASPLDIHPDHRHAARTVYESIREIPENENIRLAFYEVVVPFRPTHVVDVTSVYSRKQAAMESFVTQQEEMDYLSKVTAFNHYRSFTLPTSVQYVETFWILHPNQGGPLSFEYLRNANYFNIDRRQETPLVSLILRTRNRPEWLRQALTSVQAQTYTNTEVIVVNDGGEEIDDILDFFRKHLDIKTVTHSECRGRAAAANTGIALATGKYLNFLDDDDLLYPHHIESLVRYAQQTGARLVYSDCDVVRYEWNDRELVPIERQRFRRNDPVEWGTLLFENQLPSMTVLFERELLEEAGSFDESFEIYEDWDFWIRLSAHAEPRHLADVTAEYRQMGEQGVGVGGRSYNFWEWTARIWKKHWSGITPERLRRYQERIIGSRMQLLKQKIEQEKSVMNQQLQAQQQANAALHREHSRLAEEHDRICRAYNQMGEDHHRLAQEHDRTVQEHNWLAKEHDRVCREFNQLGQEHRQLSQEHSQLIREHDRLILERDQLRQECERMHHENVRIQQEKKELEAEKQSLESFIKDIQSSTSWQITSPYRRIGKWLKGP